MRVLSKLTQTLSRGKPSSPGHMCPWCGESVMGEIERVPMNGRLYHAECAVAQMDTDVPSVDGTREPPVS
jgi:hypothetical protein